MAVSLLGASDARVDYGDIAAIAGASALTVAVTIKFSAAPTALPMVTQWSDVGFANAAFFLGSQVSGAVKLLTSDGSGNYYGKETTSLTTTNGGTYRICAKVNPASNVGAIWVNGTAETVTAFVGSSNITLANSGSSVLVGRETASPSDGQDGEYSEVAIWAEYVPDWFCEAYGKGFAPSFYQSGLVLYAPLFNTSHLLDVKGGVTGTNTGGTDAAHPSMIYRRSAR